MFILQLSVIWFLFISVGPSITKLVLLLAGFLKLRKIILNFFFYDSKREFPLHVLNRNRNHG